MNARGFTLMEVLIAISLLTIVTFAVYLSFSGVTDSMAATRVSAGVMPRTISNISRIGANSGARFSLER